MINDDSPASGDVPIVQPFDQTNGLVEGLEGDSDGTAASDVNSAQDRAGENRNPGDGSAALFQGHSQ